MTIVLRPYQEETISRVREGFLAHRRVLMVMPTGAGKTAAFSSMVRRARDRGKRIVLVAHRIEIVDQISRALARFGIGHSVLAPGHKLEPSAPVIAAMVQSLSRRLDAIAEPDMLVVDEAHHATAGTYQRVMQAWPKTYVLGASASPARTDGQGLGECFDHMVLGPDVRELISRGYLAPFRCYAPPMVADLSGVKSRAGDFAQDQVAAAMDKRQVTGDAVKHYASHLNGRPAIAFCSSVEHAEHVAQQFREAGWKAASVDGAMHLGERQDRIAAIGDGRLNVLTSCDVISEGTDIPAVSGAILLRPTQSLIVYMQQVGRVLRPKADGSAAIILDHVGNIPRHGMPDAPREWSLSGRVARPSGSALAVRQCTQCYAAFAPAPKCPECGFVFPVKNRAASMRQVAGDLQEISELDVKVAKAAELKAAMAKAVSLRDFQEIARRFDYKARWAWVQFQLRQKYRRRSAA